MDEAYSNKKHIYLFFILLWLTIASALTFKSALLQYHTSGEVNYYDLFDMSFYYFLPVIIWSFLTPLLIKFTDFKPLQLKSWRQNIFFHLILSIILAPLTRVISIFLDFTIKNITGMVETSAWEVLKSVKLVAIASLPNSFLYYWVVVGLYSFYQYYWSQKNKADLSISLKGLLSFSENGKSHIIDTSEVSHIEASRNNILIHHQERVLKVRKTLTTVSRELDPKLFYQVHRSFIVNIMEIDFLKHWRRGEYLIQLKNGAILTSSRSYKSNVDSILSLK